MNNILKQFDIGFREAQITPHGRGLINSTWFVETPESKYLLQRVNSHVFKDIPALMRNIVLVTSHLRKRSVNPEKEILNLIRAKNGGNYYLDSSGGYWRMYDYIQNTICYDQVTKAQHAYEAGIAFGRFQSQVIDMQPDLIVPTIPDFLNMEKRLDTFEEAIKIDRVGRVKNVTPQIELIRDRANEMCFFQHTSLPVRVTHNDTKLSNVLFDLNDRAQCVIDLDTVMPGYAAYDFGDALRTIINTASEEEQDISKINLNSTFFKAFSTGYLQQAAQFISPEEVKSLIKGMLLLPYMQAVRFLTDHLDGDKYYPVNYLGHNLRRADSQLVLFLKIEEQRLLLDNTIQEIYKNQLQQLQS